MVMDIQEPRAKLDLVVCVCVSSLAKIIFAPCISSRERKKKVNILLLIFFDYQKKRNSEENKTRCFSSSYSNPKAYSYKNTR